MDKDTKKTYDNCYRVLNDAFEPIGRKFSAVRFLEQFTREARTYLEELETSVLYGDKNDDLGNAPEEV